MAYTITKFLKFSFITGLNEQEVIGHSLSFLIEGFETSSSLLTFALYEIARNPDVQSNLYNEITQVLGDGDITFDAIQEMKYLECVMNGK